MNCQSFHQTFSDYLDGVLDAADADRVRRHLAACEPCRRMEAAYRAGVATLREREWPCPARDLSVRILHRIRRERRLPALFGAYGAAAAALLMTLGAAVALDLYERDRAEPRVARADPTPPAAGRFDHITVRMRDASEAPPLDPYAVVHAVDRAATFRVTMEVPAVWTGR